MRIAVIGSGIAGLATAYLLRRAHDVVLFERDPRLGGHAHTHTVSLGGRDWSLDSGFIVFNYKTYPNFVRLLRQLDVKAQPSDMAHSVQCERCNLEYSSYGLRGFFAQERRWLDPQHLRLLADLPRFFRQARALLNQPPSVDCSLSELLDAGHYSESFIYHYLLPMGATVWSAPRGAMRAFSARQFLGFLQNHGKLALSGAPQWYTVEGGSKSYVDAIARTLDGSIRLNQPVLRVCRDDTGVDVQLPDGRERFDAVVFATHADVTLRLLGDATVAEREALGSFKYSRNSAVLHTGGSLLPKAPRARASWNTLLQDCRDEQRPVQVTYDLNRLQGLPPDAPQFCVTLNDDMPLFGEEIARMQYEHPIQDAVAIAAQPRVRALNGSNRSYFCGAYLRHGFHEDGLVSALDVAGYFGLSL